MKRRLLNALAVLVVAGGLACGVPAAANAGGEGGGDNAAIAVNTKDGATVFRVAFAIRHVMNGVVDQTNAAVAYASCTDCATVAIAIEIVLVESNANVVTPTNIALAYNELCSLCVTVADALQFVLSTGGPVHFDKEGNKILADIRKELEKLKHKDLTLAELQATVEDIRALIRDVLANHLVPSGKPEEPQPPPPAATVPTPTTTEGTTTTTESTPTETTPPTTATTTTTTTGP